MWEPIVKENKLYGLSLNPLGKEPKKYIHIHSKKVRQVWRMWKKLESQRRLVEVDEAEYKLKESHYAGVVESLTVEILSSSEYLTESKTFTADESNNKIINLKII